MQNAASTIRRGLLCLLATMGFAITAGADYQLIQRPLDNDPMKTHIYQLENGLTVYLSENHESPRFYAELAVRAGSKHDPAETTGLAHYLEHLLFKGNQTFGTLDYAAEKVHLDKITDLYEQHFSEADPEKRKVIYEEINKEAQLGAQYSIPNELDKMYKAMGGTALNAHTWQEETVYKVDLPANRLQQWATIESNRFVNPVFRLFHTELETVYEEKNRSMDNKDRAIYDAVMKQLYKKHPYGQQETLGTVEALKKPSIKNIYKFYHTYYVPNNMAIVISGDIRIPEAMEIIDTAFSGWERKDLPETPTWEESPIGGREAVEVHFQAEEYALLAYRTAGRNDPDAEALMLIDMIFDNSVAGLINLNLNQQQRVRAAGSYPQLYNDYGSQQFWAIPKAGQTLEEVEQLLLEQIEIVRNGAFDEWIIPAIINDFKKNQKAGLESNTARVSTMRDSYLAFQDWGHTAAQIDRMAKLTKDDIVRVAQKYFGQGYVAGYRRDAQHEVPKIEKPIIDSIEIDPTRESAFVRNVLSMAVDPIEPVFVDPDKDYIKEAYADGVTLYYSPNPINDLFSLSIVVEKGTQHDKRLGMAAMFLDKAGAGSFSAEDLKKEWYKLGSSFSFGAGDNSSVLSISGLDEQFEETLKLAASLVSEPIAEQATLDELIQITLARREDSKKDPQSLHQALYNYNRFGDKSSFKDRLSAEQLKALTAEELLALPTSLLGYEQTIIYTGALPLEKVKTILARHYTPEPNLQATPAPVLLKAREVEQSEILFHNKEMAQAQVRIEFGDGPYTEGNLPATQLFNEYFAGGMGGLVFQELRESRALAYSAGARYVFGSRVDDENLMLGAIGCQADKTNEALTAFIELYDAMPESPERFDGAVQSLINLYRTSKIGFREVVGSVRGWEDLGLAPDPRKARYAAIQNATMATMLDFYTEHIQNRPKLISVLGDKTKFDLAALEQFGTIREVALEDLFSE